MTALRGVIVAELRDGPYGGTRGEVVRDPDGTPRRMLRLPETGGFVYALDQRASTPDLAVYRFDEDASPAVIDAKAKGLW